MSRITRRGRPQHPPPKKNKVNAWTEEINSHQHLGIHLHKHFCKGAVLRGKNGAHKGSETFFAMFPSSCYNSTCQQKHAQLKITRENATKIGVSEDHWLQRQFADRFFMKTVFPLSRFRCEIAMNVFRGRSHKTTSKPKSTTKFGISRGSNDKTGWRKLRPNHAFKNGMRVHAKTVRLCCAT